MSDEGEGARQTEMKRKKGIASIFVLIFSSHKIFLMLVLFRRCRFFRHFSGVLIRYCASPFLRQLRQNSIFDRTHKFTKSINQICWHKTYATQNTHTQTDFLRGLFILEKDIGFHMTLFYWHTKWINKFKWIIICNKYRN